MTEVNHTVARGNGVQVEAAEAADGAAATTPVRANRARLNRALENDENRAPDGESKRSRILRRISSMRAKFAAAELQMQA